MSAIAQPVAATAQGRERQPSGWDHLKPLVPYVLRYKGMVALGLVLDALMGIVGALPQLDAGNHHRLPERSSAASHAR